MITGNAFTFFKTSLNIPRICKSTTDRKFNGQKKKYKGTDNNLQNTTQKTKDRVP